jgi:hypothetical protein
MRITIPDDLADQYQLQADAQHKSLDQIITAQLQRHVAHPPGIPLIIVGKLAAQAIAERTGGIPLKDDADVVKRFDRLAGISFRKKNIDLSPAQLEDLAARATRQGRSIEKLIEEIYQRVREEFHLATGAPTPQAKSA